MKLPKQIKMVDLHGQYLKIKEEIDKAFQEIMNESRFIKGKQVEEFENDLKNYLKVSNVISCANGTDALQIAMMAFDFEPDAEIIIPVHTYVATAEVVALLGLKPVFVDVDPDYFTIDINKTAELITSKTAAVVPVHLYGQSADMESLMNLIRGKSIKIIEDNAQALSSDFIFENGKKRKAGTIGDIGTTSFFPTKNLGCYGDGGAIFTQDEDLAIIIRMIATHGQPSKYVHDLVGVNSRLDTIQAAFLKIKLKYLEQYSESRRKVAQWYDDTLSDLREIQLPQRAPYSSHVFHQYTIKTGKGDRNSLKEFLNQNGIPTQIYYPIPLHRQKAYEGYASQSFPVSEKLSETVLSLPIHTEIDEESVEYISSAIRKFFRG